MTSTNLLGGRAGTKFLHPFVYTEVARDRDLFPRVFRTGLLPSFYLSESSEEDLRSYVGTYLALELKAWIYYRHPTSSIAYWRSTSGFEVDFLLDDRIAIEVKTTKIAHEKHLAGLRALREEGTLEKFILVCMEERPRLVDGILILPWKESLESLWAEAL